MTTIDYRPIACGAYDEIEILAMRRARVEVVSLDDDGHQVRRAGQVVDTAIHDGAEFLVLLSGGDRLEIRLDRIERIQDQDSGRVWLG